MNSLKILLKNSFNILLGRLQGKKKRKSTKAAIWLMTLGIVGIFALSLLQAWSMFKGLGEMGLGKLCVFHGIIITLTTVLIIGIMRVSGKPKGNDSDFLLSLPIKKHIIIISKLASKYIFDLFFSILLLLPFVIMYEVTAPSFSIPVLVFGVLTVFLLPLLSVGISQIVEFITVRVFNKIKFGAVLKSLVPTIIYIALMVLMILKTSGYGGVKPDSMEAYFQDRWFSNQILTFVFDQTFISILAFVGITLATFVIGVILQTSIYGKNYGVYSKNSAKIELKGPKQPFNHLFSKEIKNYFSTPAYLVNTIIGPILILVASIAVLIFGIETIKNLIPIELSNIDMSSIFALVVNFCIATTCISCVSVSLEGKSMWLLKSLPISKNQIFISKLFVPIVIVLPCILVGSVIIGILLGSVTSGLIVLGITLLYLILTDIFGLLVNLWFPKLNYEDETQVVKQSMSTLISMLVNFVLLIIPVGIYLIFKISIPLISIITVGVYLLLLIIFTIILFTKGKNIFDKLET